MDNALSGSRPLFIAAACLPLAARAAAVAGSVEPALWLAMPASLRFTLAADALLYTSVCAIVAAPVAGVAAAMRIRAGRSVAAVTWPSLIALALFVSVSGVLTAAWGVAGGEVTDFVTRSHATLFAVTLGLTAWGALCGLWFRDALDAAAVALLVVVIAAGGLLLGGAGVAELPSRALTAGLLASPLVVLASAASIDIVRVGALYQISPLAHMQMNYPAWQLACGSYLGLALLCWGSVTWKVRT